MKFAAIFTFIALSALTRASPLPIALTTSEVTTATTPTEVTSTSTSSTWAIPTGGTSCNVHCDPAFLRAADDEDPENAVIYRRACARACF